MSDDLIAELQLIDFSRCQREALDRWLPILLTIGEPDAAEDIRFAMAVQDNQTSQKDLAA